MGQRLREDIMDDVDGGFIGIWTQKKAGEVRC